MIIRFPVSGVRSMGRNTQGVRLINLDETDRVVAALKLEKEQVEDVGDEPDEPIEPVETTPSSEPPPDDTIH